MSSYRYAVKVSAPRLATRNAETWTEYEIHCQGCLGVAFYRRRRRALRFARKHAATCEDLHRLNWDAACPSCKLFGRVAKACPECLGRGWCK